jgi:glycosyltransferase involved in cell wall biosynthesis
LRVLLVNDHYEYGGAEKYVRQLERQLRTNHEVAVLTLDGADESEYSVRERSNPLLKLKNRYAKSSRLRQKVREVVNQFGPDVVHLHKNVIAPASVLSALRGERVIKTVHDFGFVSVKDKYAYDMCQLEQMVREPLERFAKGRLQGLLRDVVRLYVAPSVALTQALRNHRYEPAEHIPNFVERRDPQFGGDHFLYVGRLEAGKAPDLLVRAYADADGDQPILKVAGKGKMKNELEDFVESRSLGSNISLEGFVSERRLRSLYRNAKALVIPSRWQENNPLVALEAKAYGVPLIVSDRGGLPELVEDGQTGFVFNSGDVSALSRVISRSVDWASLGERSYQDYLNNYTPERHFQMLLSRYNDVRSRTKK